MAHDCTAQNASRPTRDRWLLLFLAGLIFVPPALINPIAGVDEGLYAAVARNVLETGDWLTFWFNGKYFFDKPPLLIWATALSFQAFGVGDFSARLAAVLSGIACVALVFEFCRRIAGPRAGFVAGLVLLSSQDFARFAAKGQLDVPLTFLLTAQLFAFWHGLDRPSRHWLSGIFLGLALITKNQAGLLGVFVEIAYVVLARDPRAIKQWQWYASFVVAGLIAAPWFVHQFVTHGQAFVDGYLFFNYRLKLALSKGDYINRQPDRWFYLKYLVDRHLVLLLMALYGLGWAAVQSLRRGDRLPVLLAAWVLVIPAVFSIWKAELYWYLIPMYPAVAILAGLAIHDSTLFRKKPAWAMTSLAAWAIAFQVSYYVPPPKDEPLWAAKRLAPSVQAHVPMTDVVYLLQTSNQGDLRSIQPETAHFYFNRVVVRIMSSEQFEQVLQRGGPIYGVVQNAMLQEAYGPMMEFAPAEMIATACNATLLRFAPALSQTRGEPRSSSERPL